MKYRGLRGTRDILPEETQVWQRVEEICREIFAGYNYQEIRLPIIEATELFSRSLGTSTDIVEKQMYTFLDKKGRSVTLRPEGTAGVIRSYIQNVLYHQEPISRLYYLGPMYRYERPQAGRYREFYQIGAELIGSESPWADVEIISLVVDCLKKLGLSLSPSPQSSPPRGEGQGKGLKLWINSVGCANCRPRYKEALKKSLESKLSMLCADCQRRFNINPLRVLDCKKDKNFFDNLPASASLPKITDSLCPKCKENFQEIENKLQDIGISYEIDPWLVRGLDYYTRVVFEVKSPELGEEETVIAGGRYDNLSEELGGPSIPALGFSLGMERLIKTLRLNKSSLFETTQQLNLYFICLSEKSAKEATRLSHHLREKNISVVINYGGKSLKAQLRQANNSGANYVAILGEDELTKQVVTLRNMQTHQQQTIPWNSLEDLIRE